MTEKKIIILLILIILSFNSCQKIEPSDNNKVRGKGSTLVSQEDSTNYYFELRNINTKFDVNTGDKQCKGYGMGYSQPNEVYTYGLNIKNALSIILDIPRKDIILKSKEYEKHYFEFNYKSKNDLGKIDTNVVINKILDEYNLKLQTDSVTVKAFNLKILDSFKLKNSLSKNKIGEYSYAYENFETELKGVTLKHLADYMNKQSPFYHFFSETEINNSYDVKLIPRSNIESLNKVLEEKYGLIFEKDSLKITIITIANKNFTKMKNSDRFSLKKDN